MSADLTSPPGPPLAPPEMIPDLSAYITEDGAPVDNYFHASQMVLLVESLRTGWPGPGGGRPFLVKKNVGVYHTAKKPAVVPDVMLALDVELGDDLSLPENRAYFAWVVGKVPDLAIEIVSPTPGGEDTTKMDLYAQIAIPFYAIFDPEHHLHPDDLRAFARDGRKYRPIPGVPLGDLGLGLTVWEGEYDAVTARWLRWTDADGNLIPTGAERAAAAEQRAADVLLTAKAAVQRADREKQRADAEAERARLMAEKLARYEAWLRDAGLSANGE